MPAGLAAGEKGEPPTSGQWELLTTTNATKRGTHKNGHTRHRLAGLTWPACGRRLGAGLLAHRAHGSNPRDRNQDTFTRGGNGPERPTKPDWIGSGFIRRKTSRSLAIFCRRARAVARALHGMGLIGVISSPLPCYGFSSCLRKVGGGLGQFRPVLMPIKRPHLLNRHSATGERIDGATVFRRDRFFPAHHF